MSEKLPHRVSPLALARDGVALRGSVPLARMTRLADALLGTDGDVSLEMRFELDDMGRARLLGNVSGAVQMRCQRCLEPVTVPVDRPISLAVVATDEEAAALGSDADPLLLGDEAPVALGAIVEDELIISLPDFPAHPAGTCAMPPGADAADAGDQPSRENPFAVLKALKEHETP